MPARGRGRARLLAVLGCTVAGWSAAAVAQPAPAPAISSFGKYQPAKTYTEQVTSSFYLPMRDGTRLAVNVARPAVGGKAVEGRFPVIWHHSLSATQEPADGTGPRAAGFRSIPNLSDYGYIVVQVARRGNGQSFGTMRGYHDRNEAQDAYEIVEWLAAQPWSDGKVGVYGCSNTGDAAMHVMTMRPPHLKAVFAGCFSWHKYDAFRRGGIFAQWGTGPTRSVEQDMAVKPVDTDPDKKLLRIAAEEHQRAVPLFELWKSLPYRDSFTPLLQSNFWAEGSASSYADQVRLSGAALYIVGGWRDELRDQGLITHLNIPGSRVVIGDWLHCENVGFALVEEAHRFFDDRLKGIDTGIQRDPPIHYFRVNAAPGTEWRSSPSWPVPGMQGRKFDLGRSGTFAPEGRAAAAPPATLTVNYDAPCKGEGEGPRAQPCHPVAGGLGYAGERLARDTEVTGNGLVDLWIAADAPDANIFAYLEDVAPDGTVRVVTEGRQKASLRSTATAPWKMPAGVPWHRSYAADAAPLKPGEAVKLSFELMPTSYVFKVGHRIQLTFAGADYRERARDTSGLAKRVTIFSDAQRRSSMVLPIVD